MADVLDPRIDTLFRGRSPERFLALALVELLGPERTEKIIGQFGNNEVSWNEIVAGQPLLNFNGKTVEQLRRGDGLSEQQIGEVRDAMARRGVTLQEAGPVGSTAPAPLTSDTTRASSLQVANQIEQQAAAQSFPAPVTPPASTADVIREAANVDASNAGDTGEPVIAGKPLSFYGSKTRQQLLKDNVPPVVIDQVLAARKQAPDKADKTTDPPAPATPAEKH